MLSDDLAKLYGVPTKVFNQAVKRWPERFPEDFMFRLTSDEHNSLRSQIVTLEKGRGRSSKFLPYAFTEHGVAMLSSVLNSKTAIQVNIKIVRTFIQLKNEVFSYQDLLLKICELEKKYDHQFQVVFKAIKLLVDKTKDSRHERF